MTLEEAQKRIEELVAKNDALHAKQAEMEGDVKAVVEVFIGLAQTLGLKSEDFQGGTADIGAKLPGILQKVIVQLTTGSFDTQSIQNMTAVSPIMEKYKYLVEDILPENGEQS
jgi:hypothetical protein